VASFPRHGRVQMMFLDLEADLLGPGLVLLEQLEREIECASHVFPVDCRPQLVHQLFTLIEQSQLRPSLEGRFLQQRVDDERHEAGEVTLQTLGVLAVGLRIDLAPGDSFRGVAAREAAIRDRRAHDLHVGIVAADVVQPEDLTQRRLRLECVVLGHSSAQDEDSELLGVLLESPVVVRTELEDIHARVDVVPELLSVTLAREHAHLDGVQLGTAIARCSDVDRDAQLVAGAEQSGRDAESFLLRSVVLAEEIVALGRGHVALELRLSEHGGDHAVLLVEHFFRETGVGHADDACLSVGTIIAMQLHGADRSLLVVLERVVSVVITDRVGRRDDTDPASLEQRDQPGARLVGDGDRSRHRDDEGRLLEDGIVEDRVDSTQDRSPESRQCVPEDFHDGLALVDRLHVDGRPHQGGPFLLATARILGVVH
jgi:hypothetical protein